MEHARADQVQLISGAVIEGVPVGDGDDVVRLETPSGVLVLPRGAMARQIPGPTRWTRYERELSSELLTAQRHLEIARWCMASGLERRHGEHIAAALELDPTCEDALAEAGYVRVGEVWMKAVSPPSAEDLDRQAAARERRQAEVVRQLLHAWRLRVRAVRDAYLRGGGSRASGRAAFDEGRRRLLELDEPLAIPAICLVLSDDDRPQSRVLLVEVLAESEMDTAILNLLALTLLDGDASVRSAAAAALADRAAPRVSRLLRHALVCRNDVVVRRAAQVLGRLRDRSAVPDLIDALTASESTSGTPDVRAVFEAATESLNQPIAVALGENGATHPSEVAVAAYQRALSRRADDASSRRGALRTEVQEALIAITGQNYGFDADAWRVWWRENQAPPEEASQQAAFR
jgi:HEAT repeat protein